MIFVTVGTQLAFDRLVGAVDAWASGHEERVVAQAGPDADGARWPSIEARGHMTPKEYEAQFSAARVVVGHAGIGTILSAQRFGKPLVILPRRQALGEHRNDHQMATAREVSRLKGIHIAWEAAEIPALLAQDLVAAETDGGDSRARLISRLRTFIDEA